MRDDEYVDADVEDDEDIEDFDDDELTLQERQRAEARRINIGSKIRKLRARRMLTMEAVARAAGCSRAFLSRVERSESMPSVATLVDIANALGVPVGFFFDESEAEQAVVVTPEERQRVEDEGVVSETMTRDVLTRKMTMMRVELPGRAETTPKRHKYHDEVCGLVTKGRVQISCDHRVFEVGEGDTFYLDSPAPYQVENLTDDTAEMLVINCKQTY
ncbi:MAG: helix-turn-helix domain-containing protein [Armatimonadia bacterium]|nr:helix-turn-helix domain-containing protein [Armatimonadia bacterium]